nr:unnamed protein product [Callosobruchus analis]
MKQRNAHYDVAIKLASLIKEEAITKEGIYFVGALQQPQVSESDILDKIKPALEAMIKNCLFEALSNIQPLQLSAPLPPPQDKDPGSNVSRSRSTSETLSLPKRKASSPAEESESDGSQLSTETRSSARRGRPLSIFNLILSFLRKLCKYKADNTIFITIISKKLKLTARFAAARIPQLPINMIRPQPSNIEISNISRNLSIQCPPVSGFGFVMRAVRPQLPVLHFEKLHSHTCVVGNTPPYYHRFIVQSGKQSSIITDVGIPLKGKFIRVAK